ncbi:hypothetical protein Ocin01_04480 [Orchesella cincta]|uniref:Uncharacterized protein n=1 Tax=Orchesella cincta TaxID=48709 RepID=A0A1D2NAC7_ORCCI|nr:hypothetical protein Ocin01_04480 [Orchesella cincta]
MRSLRMCYHCNSYSQSGTSCVHNPSNVTDGEISCKGYCTIKRKKYVNFPLSLISLQRHAKKHPQVFDAVVVEGLKDIPIDPAWDMYPDEDIDANSAFNRLPRLI